MGIEIGVVAQDCHVVDYLQIVSARMIINIVSGVPHVVIYLRGKSLHLGGGLQIRIFCDSDLM